MVRIYGILDFMSAPLDVNYGIIYRNFKAPIAEIDCGDKCAPFNERGIPFCCDTQHAIPTAHRDEWDYLRVKTNLWHPWKPVVQEDYDRLKEITPEDHILISCLGHEKCQREYRSITCRTFPFFPYINQQGSFLGISVYWEYEDRCWIISNLNVVTRLYQDQFISTFDKIFEKDFGEHEIYRRHSELARHVFAQKKRSILLLHRDGSIRRVSPHSGRMRSVPTQQLPRFGVYKLAKEMPFPDEK